MQQRMVEHRTLCRQCWPRSMHRLHHKRPVQWPAQRRSRPCTATQKPGAGAGNGMVVERAKAYCHTSCRLQQRAQSFALAHPFAPSLVAKQPAQPVADLDGARRRRRQRALQQRLHDQFRELQECTFQPRVHARQPPQGSAPHVRGLDRHLRLRALADEQRRQQQEREAKVFVLHPKQADALTVPVPFKLGNEALQVKAKLRAKQVKEELLHIVSKECTFTPRLVARQKPRV